MLALILDILLQTGTPDTNSYMIGGYAVFFIVMVLYLGSLVLRQRNLEQDLAALQELERDEK